MFNQVVPRVKQMLPKKVQRTVVNINYGLIKLKYRLQFSLHGSKYTCPFCNESFQRFLPTGLSYDVLEKKNVVGGGHRKNAICPSCNSTDRDRLVYLFLRSKNLLEPKIKLLHIAPEIHLKNIFKKKSNINYYSADLNGPPAKIKMDIQNIGFPEDCFDAIICNHVLEHIVDDKKAMNELYRVLNPGGWAILQVPYSPMINDTFEDSSVTDSLERAKKFGQSNHVRIYGTDYPDRLQSVGFSVKQEKIGDDLTKKFALNPNEKIFFCVKQ